MALDAHRINHAYLFSGPRGCGKTSSARILARSLNCVEGPTSTPCGHCDSCRALAPGGPGNLDVTELDAASHNGVEDMRELRDRGHYAPAESRYRIFIIDEAHMISQQGFNALLKIVEEPPEHLIFIFATTEPEKVIGTIRSRTHNYPFRLLTPPDMKSLLQHVVDEENVQVEDAVYPLVMQAGGGSPRDTLSLLDQLLAGAKDGELTYQQAAPLLGVTDLALIDRVIGALANDEKGELFRIVHDVINAGHEPRRFVEDLLDRLRDLLIIQSVPEAFKEGLVSAPQDRVSVLQEQAGWFSPEALTHYADVVNERLPQMRGATSPQLLLEILCAHLLARPYAVGSASGAGTAESAGANPGAVVNSNGAGAGAGAGAGPGPGSGAGAGSATGPGEGARGPGDGAGAATTAGQRGQTGVGERKSAQPAGAPRGAAAAIAAVNAMGAGQPETKSTPSHGPAPKRTEEPAQHERAETPVSSEHSAQPADALEIIRSRWNTIRSQVGEKNRVAEVMLTEAKVLGVDDDATVVLGHNTGALAERINSERNNSVIAEAMSAAVDKKVQVRCIVGTKVPAELSVQTKNTQPQKTPSKDEAVDSSPQQEAPQQESARQDSSSQEWAQQESSQESVRQESSQPPQSSPRQSSARDAEKPQAKNDDWREVAAAARNRARQRSAQSGADTFGDGVPLPPEPASEDGVPDEQAPQPTQSYQPTPAPQAPQSEQSARTEQQPKSAQQPQAQSTQQPDVQGGPQQRSASSSTATSGGEYRASAGSAANAAAAETPAKPANPETAEKPANPENAGGADERSPEQIHAAARQLLETELGARPL